jgi:hypothetical protein
MMRDVRHGFGFFLAPLAVVAQLLLAATMPAAAVSLAGATALCQHRGDSDAPSAPARQMPDCLLCFVCHGATSPTGLIAAPPDLPALTVTLIARHVVLPPATAPPLQPVTAARPRAPPILI